MVAMEWCDHCCRLCQITIVTADGIPHSCCTQCGKLLRELLHSNETTNQSHKRMKRGRKTNSVEKLTKKRNICNGIASNGADIKE